ncbi:Fungal specific transcription factor domain [Geosmithia morbida]|uniref:Fungal specific transcription factor domain n=1 Tax=Geosmithia morbida TaxID=1094350 RepID=A0A9P5D1Z7_9HYPO|nr:Fungal specific transcription factor domain [Geosmithia morbida]KAF4124473.1 Fungal specific transcription factor domain [Geosmithia morbida]
MSVQLFSNVCGLFEQIDAQFTSRSVDESVGAQMTAFCIYSCGLRVWPLASRWIDSLNKIFRDPDALPLAHEGSMTEGKVQSPPDMLTWESAPPSTPVQSQQSRDMSSSFSGSMYSQPATAFDYSQQQQHQQHREDPVPPHPNTFPSFDGLMVSAAQPHASMYFQRTAAMHHHHHHHQQQQQQQQQQQPTPTVDNMGVLVDRYDSAHPAAAARAASAPTASHSTYDTTPFASSIPMTSTTAAFYPGAELGPRNDGFENELQSYIGESSGRWNKYASWVD